MDVEAENVLVQRIEEALSSRSDWQTKDENVIQRRLAMRPAKKQIPYAGAPNFVEPIIDDVVHERTDQEVSMLFNAPRLCHAAPMQSMEPASRIKVEIAFDSYVRYIVPMARAKIESGLDCKNARGFTVYKMLRSYNCFLKLDIADFEVCDILDILVPGDSPSDVQGCEWIAHTLRYSVRKFKDRAKKKGWNAEAVAKIVETYTTERTGSGRHGKDTFEISKKLMGVTQDKQMKYVIVEEMYGYASADDAEDDESGEIIEGKKIVTIFCPDLPEEPLAKFPWKEEDTVEQVALTPEEVAAAKAMSPPGAMVSMMKTVTTVGEDKPFPFVYCPNERRSLYWYDSRGIGHTCMDEQLAATATRNAKGVMMEYYMTPLLRSASGSKNSMSITFEPGSSIGDYEFVVPPNIPQQFDFDINGYRASAGRRGGAGGQYNYSESISATRKVQKTATEVGAEQSRTSAMSSASVDRFNEPMAELFQMLWDDMKRMGLVFPAMIPGRAAMNFDPTWYEVSLKMIPAASAKTLDPESQLAKSMQVYTFNAGYGQHTGFDYQAAMRVINAAYDPRMTDGWIPDEEAMKPFAAQIAQLDGEIKQLAQAGSDTLNRLNNVETLSSQTHNEVKMTKGVDKNRYAREVHPPLSMVPQ